jgi:histidyl-tRNA synthetase
MMIFEHEIPSGSHLYFGKSAKIKRELEAEASKLLNELGFEEIVTPLFSYHQHESFDETAELIRLNDAQNHEVTLRADSTVDVVRIVTKRLGRSMQSKRWFYIQPALFYPTREQYQIGAEVIGGTFTEVAEVAMTLLHKLEVEATIQVSNIRIPHLLNEKYGISLEVLKSMKIEQILKSDLPWIEALVRISQVEDLKDLSKFPEDIGEELEQLKSSVESLGGNNIVVSPLFYAKMRYYDSLTFRMFHGNALLATGGTYTVNGVEGAGFALFSDACMVQKLEQK